MIDNLAKKMLTNGARFDIRVFYLKKNLLTNLRKKIGDTTGFEFDLHRSLNQPNVAIFRSLLSEFERKNYD